MDLPSAARNKRYPVVLNDPKPIEDVDFWMLAARISTVGMFLLAIGLCLYFSRPILLPIFAAIIVGTTLRPLVKRAAAVGVAPWMTALLLVVVMAAALGLAASFLAKPVSEWIARAPEIAATVKQKLYVLDRPLSGLREIQNAITPAPAGDAVKVQSTDSNMLEPLVSTVTPALTELMVFFVTLIFYLIGQMELRTQLAMMFPSRDAKLRFLRITNDIEHNLASYLALVTVVNCSLGIVVGIGAWMFGFPSPLTFGILAMVFNYVPYIGPAAMAIVLFVVGLVSFPSFGQALVPPACFVVLTTLEGQILTPAVLGHQLTLNPLAVFLALAFWTWMWGPFGAFLAVPLSIIALVIFNHLFPADEAKLPG